jgi:CRP/FNR family cyclic AMP-dependent transcriptional regulator
LGAAGVRATNKFWAIRPPKCGCTGLSTALVAARIGSVTVPMKSGVLLEPESVAALLEAEDWAALQACGQRGKVARAAVLMYEGDPGDRVIVLLAGRVKVTTTGDDGQETLLSVRGPGEILGELSFLDDQPRFSTVTTLEPVEILAIAAAAFGRYLEERPRVALVILRTLSARFRDASRKRVQFRELDTVGRLAARLVELSERYGEVTPEGTIISLHSRRRSSVPGPARRTRASPRRCRCCASWAGSGHNASGSSLSTSMRCATAARRTDRPHGWQPADGGVSRGGDRSPATGRSSGDALTCGAAWPAQC